ncbi:MAG: hypothetical protein ACKO3K_15585 [Cuspidothrix sp.]
MNIPTEDNILKPKELKEKLQQKLKAYEARFKRNQFANNAIIGTSILLTILIAITGTSPTFKDQQNPWANPLGVSASAWLGLISTVLLSIQKLYNIQEKIAFYPEYIVKVEELLEDFEAIKTEKDLEDIRDKFRKMRAEEATKRPIEKDQF